LYLVVIKNLYATQKLQTYGLGESNYYVGYYMQSEVDHLFKKIISFDATTRLATLDSDTGSTDWASAVNIPWWGKNFTIRKELSILGRLDMLGPNAFTPSKVRLDPKIVNPGVLPLTFSSTLSDIANYYVGYFLRVVSIYQTNGYPSPQTEERRIVEYDPTTYTFTVYPPFSSAKLPFFP
jgi:hypothetical protein